MATHNINAKKSNEEVILNDENIEPISEPSQNNNNNNTTVDSPPIEPNQKEETSTTSNLTPQKTRLNQYLNVAPTKCSISPNGIKLVL